MKAVTLTQPWATAVARGVKRIETRGWSTGYRGWLAIHAAKGWTVADREFALEAAFPYLGLYPEQYPRGVVVCVAKLVDVRPVEKLPRVSVEDWLFGNFEPGRFGWVLEDVYAFGEPVPAVGKQGLWDLAPETVVEMRRQRFGDAA